MKADTDDGTCDKESRLDGSSALKVLLIIEALDGGGGRHVTDLALGLVQHGYDVWLIHGSERNSRRLTEELMQKQDAHLHVRQCSSLRRALSVQHDFAAYAFLRTIVRAVNPDIVHCHSSKAGILGRLAARSGHCKAVFYTPHAYSFQAPEFSRRKRRLFVFLERWFSRLLTTKTFNVSQGERNEAIKNGIDVPAKFRVIPNGIADVNLPSPDEAKKLIGLCARNKVVGTVARLSGQKNPVEFCKIAQAVIQKDPNVHFVYIGDGPLYGVTQSYISEHHLTNNIHLLGARDDADRLIAGFDVFLLTSIYEGLPYCLIEALRAGKPIVSSRVTGVDEIVQSRDVGDLYNCGQLKQAAQLVENRLSSPIRTDLIRSEYLAKFTLADMLHTIECEYDSRAKNNGTTA